MRIDKYLKVARIIKRRTIASEMAKAGRVLINGNKAKPGTKVKVGDVLEISFGQGPCKLEVLAIKNHVRKEEVESLYRLLL